MRLRDALLAQRLTQIGPEAFVGILDKIRLRELDPITATQLLLSK
jgi:hypothetical protein